MVYSNANPPPVDLSVPPIQTYASEHPGSPDEQAYLRQQAAAKAQSTLNAKHGGRRRRRRRRALRSRRRGGAYRSPDDPPVGHITVPQSHTGVHQAGPDGANLASYMGNQSLLNGRANAQYDSLVENPPSMGKSTTGGRRRTRRRRKSHRRRRRGGRKRRTRRRRRRGGRKRSKRRTRRRLRRKKRHRRRSRGGCFTCSLG